MEVCVASRRQRFLRKRNYFEASWLGGFVCREDRRDKAASGLEHLGVAADGIRTVDEIEDRVHAVRVRCTQCVDHIDSFGVVDFVRTETASLVGVSNPAHARDNFAIAGVAPADPAKVLALFE